MVEKVAHHQPNRSGIRENESSSSVHFVGKLSLKDNLPRSRSVGGDWLIRTPKHGLKMASIKKIQLDINYIEISFTQLHKALVVFTVKFSQNIILGAPFSQIQVL